MGYLFAFILGFSIAYVGVDVVKDELVKLYTKVFKSDIQQ